MAKKDKESAPDNTQVPTFTAGGSINRPVDPPVGSIYYETDTRNRIRYIGNGKWDLIDNLK